MDAYKMGLRLNSPTRPITPDCPRGKNSSRFSMWQNFKHFFTRDGLPHRMESDGLLWTGNTRQLQPKQQEVEQLHKQQNRASKQREGSVRPTSIGLPRQCTFRRQNSEKREHLSPVRQPMYRRAASASRRTSPTLVRFRSQSLPSTQMPQTESTPTITSLAVDDSDRQRTDLPPTDNNLPASHPEHPPEYDRVRPPRPPSIVSSDMSCDDDQNDFDRRFQLNNELDTKWILNLSMHFRDKSDREKFFVTYAEEPNRWRRVTVSCDYRKAEPGSLEMDLKELQLQRDKSMQIYEAIRDSLAEIKFYDTVTNLKLETSDGRLHVHVTEDINEIIPYPPRSSLEHILEDAEFRPREIRESELSFDAHLSGFVYKVNHQGRTYIKKEIPGPDTVDEFLYEVNALHALHDSPYVIDIEGIVTDDSGSFIKGLLIAHADRGAVVDLLYDYKGELTWQEREAWARHAVQGLSDVHEEGYVQGDFTLSNIVVDKYNNAKIIDINRRGCPVGWEPPEIAKKIASNQRISMYIGQKSDLYQLGMTLWALAMDDDEPERHDPPLSTQEFPAEVPDWYQEMVRICLSPRPRDRLSATELMRMFPAEEHDTSWVSRSERPVVRIRAEKQYIDPAHAVERDDIERLGQATMSSDDIIYSTGSSGRDPTFTWPQSSSYDRDHDNVSSEFERPRGRRRISDYDLELIAQRQDHEGLNCVNVGNSLNDVPPVISVSSDGRETHVLDSDVLPMDLDSTAHDSTIHELERGVRPPSPSPRQTPDVSHLGSSQHGSFRNFSEVSEHTPRNSTLHLFDGGSQLPERPSPVDGEVIPADLAGLGGQLDIESSFYHNDHSMNRDSDYDLTSLPPPSMSFVDSGYCEPSDFGLDENGNIQEKRVDVAKDTINRRQESRRGSENEIDHDMHIDDKSKSRTETDHDITKNTTDTTDEVRDRPENVSDEAPS